MNILVTLDRNYLKPLKVMLFSLVTSDPDHDFDVYVMNDTLTAKDLAGVTRAVGSRRLRLIDVKVGDKFFAEAPLTSYYPKEMYYRILAAQILPKELDRILYLDPDLVVMRPLTPLYDMDFEHKYFIAASHVRTFMAALNKIRLRADEMENYINSGVMMINLDELRLHQDVTKVYEYIRANKAVLILPDQDVIYGLYSTKIKLVDPDVYNMTERLLAAGELSREKDIRWVVGNTAVVHYIGRNKPWKKNYVGKKAVFYYIYEDRMERQHRKGRK